MGSDFNGDGRDDILWWNRDAGTISNWLGEADGGFLVNDAAALTFVNPGPNWFWQIAGTGDFNGDGRDDILWISDDSALSNWLGTPSGGFVINDANALAQSAGWPSTIGDFNGDGRDDVLWLHVDSFVIRTGTLTGAFTQNQVIPHSLTYPQPWNLDGVGDFNGDGRDDLLWRNYLTGGVSNWLATPNGFAINDANAMHVVPPQWVVIGVGDFNGDGRDDLLWSNQYNLISNWLGTETGGFVINDTSALTVVPTDWWVAGVGDYNGDGRSDLLWRSSGGAVSNWLATETGGWLVNDAAAYAEARIDWETGSYSDGYGNGWDY